MSKRWYSHGRVCECGTPVSNNSASGRCRPCFMAWFTTDPAIPKKRAETRKRSYRENPDVRLSIIRAAKAAGASKRNNPFMRAKMAKHMRDKIQPLSVLPEHLAKRDNALTGRLSRAAKLAWCPEHLRDQYSWLCNTKRLKAAEARRIILDQAAAEKRKAPKLSPFERQERALQNGAKLVANDTLTNPADFGQAKWVAGQ